MDAEIIKKANKYGIVLFWPRPLKAEIRVRSRFRRQTLPKPAKTTDYDGAKAGAKKMSGFRTRAISYLDTQLISS
jgi:hypothetical protein